MKVSSVFLVPFCPETQKTKRREPEKIKKSAAIAPSDMDGMDALPQEINLELVAAIKKGIESGKIQFDADKLSKIIIEHHQK